MYFKRPSFKRGGATGIAQLTPRVKAQNGFMGLNFGVGQGDNSGYLEYLKKERERKLRGEPSGLAKMFLGKRYTDPNFVSPFLRKDSPFFTLHAFTASNGKNGSFNFSDFTADTILR